MSGSRDAARAGIGFGTALAIFCLAALGCDGDTPVAPTPQPSEPTLQSLEISGTTAFEGLDVMEQLAAIAQYSDGSSENVSERSTWQTSDPTVVKVSGTGLLTTIGFGEAEVTANFQNTPASALVSVTSPPDQCVLVLSKDATFNRHGGSGTLAIQVENGCFWSASTDVNWVTIVSRDRGEGPDTMTYVVAPLTNGASRTGRITVASGFSTTVSLSVLIRQDETGGDLPPFRYFVTPESRDVWQGGGLRSFTVTPTRPDARWTATSDQPWLLITEGASGTGQDVVTYRFEVNPLNISRNGTITVAGLSGLNPPAIHSVRQGRQP